jgi:hypothetical protein
VSDSLLCHGLMRDNTYRSRVEVDILLHSVLVVDRYGIPSVLCLFQSFIYLVLHLRIHLYLLVVCSTEAPGYTVRDYIVVVQYCIVVVQCYIVVPQCYMGLVIGLTMVQLALSSSLPAPYRFLMFFPSSSLLSYNLCHHGLLT